MTTYIPGNYYSFQVVEIREENDTKYIYLSDGYKETYRVKPFDYQLEWEDFNLPDKITCFVKDISIRGLPLLEQNKKDILNFCYADLGSEYAFKVINCEVDSKTQAGFYNLNDSFGLYHRYYPKLNEPKHQTGDIFNLVVNKINDKGYNKSFLDFEYPRDLVQSNNESITLEISEDPRTESLFGFESATKEFKSTIVYPAGSIEPNIDKQLSYILKTIAGFQNAAGGELYIGIDDSGKIRGINQDYIHLNSSQTDTYSYQLNMDGYENKIRSAVRFGIGGVSNSHLEFNFFNQSGLDYLIIKISQVQRPVFVHNFKLFERTGNMTQLLKGDEITYFVEHRLKLRNAPIENIEINANDSIDLDIEKEAYTEAKITEVIKDIPTFNLPEIEEIFEKDKIWKYMTLYKSGEWSFQKKPAVALDIFNEIPIFNSCKKGRIVMVYDTGCVNTVIPYDLISNKNNTSKTAKKEGKRYSNGYNSASNLIEFQCVPEEYFLVFQSKDLKTNSSYIKAHRVRDISTHTGLNAEGNVLINSRLDGLFLEVNILPEFIAHLITGLTFTKNQTSSTLGIKEGDQDYRGVVQTMKELIAKYSNHWKKKRDII
ncbi:hypothetical protein RCH18_002485 [Flavobacterium sp. PL11]|uniref:AlbA family DNA-binding domain-containing protein n=1 Tax=Flavobacterium sp. PL11 TaxID=3071717 RepID=UPI002DFF3597|nr:hypothetical protein [Flavobacterium sp. PL11]